MASGATPFDPSDPDVVPTRVMRSTLPTRSQQQYHAITYDSARHVFVIVGSVESQSEDVASQSSEEAESEPTALVLDAAKGSTLSESYFYSQEAPRFSGHQYCRFLPDVDMVLVLSDDCLRLLQASPTYMFSACLDRRLYDPEILLGAGRHASLLFTYAEAETLTVFLRTDDVDTSVQEVANEVCSILHTGIQEANERDPRAQRWSTLVVHLPFPDLVELFRSLSRTPDTLPLPVRPIVATALDRLYHLSNGAMPFDRGMTSEYFRYQSFDMWPHKSFKYANPKTLAADGFYLSTATNNNTGDVHSDRCVCFCCETALVQWEPLDTPRGEHRRHSPGCPFLRGEMTSNIPLTVTNQRSVVPNHQPGTDLPVVTSVDYNPVNRMLVTANATTGHVTLWKHNVVGWSLCVPFTVSLECDEAPFAGEEGDLTTTARKYTLLTAFSIISEGKLLIATVLTSPFVNVPAIFRMYGDPVHAKCLGDVRSTTPCSWTGAVLSPSREHLVCVSSSPHLEDLTDDGPPKLSLYSVADLATCPEEIDPIQHVEFPEFERLANPVAFSKSSSESGGAAWVIEVYPKNEPQHCDFEILGANLERLIVMEGLRNCRIASKIAIDQPPAICVVGSESVDDLEQWYLYMFPIPPKDASAEKQTMLEDLVIDHTRLQEWRSLMEYERVPFEPALPQGAEPTPVVSPTVPSSHDVESAWSFGSALFSISPKPEFELALPQPTHVAAIELVISIPDEDEPSPPAFAISVAIDTTLVFLSPDADHEIVVLDQYVIGQATVAEKRADSPTERDEAASQSVELPADLKDVKVPNAPPAIPTDEPVVLPFAKANTTAIARTRRQTPRRRGQRDKEGRRMVIRVASPTLFTTLTRTVRVRLKALEEGALLLHAPRTLQVRVFSAPDIPDPKNSPFVSALFSTATWGRLLEIATDTTSKLLPRENALQILVTAVSQCLDQSVRASLAEDHLDVTSFVRANIMAASGRVPGLSSQLLRLLVGDGHSESSRKAQRELTTACVSLLDVVDQVENPSAMHEFFDLLAWGFEAVVSSSGASDTGSEGADPIVVQIARDVLTRLEQFSQEWYERRAWEPTLLRVLDSSMCELALEEERFRCEPPSFPFEQTLPSYPCLDFTFTDSTSHAFIERDTSSVLFSQGAGACVSLDFGRRVLLTDIALSSSLLSALSISTLGDAEKDEAPIDIVSNPGASQSTHSNALVLSNLNIECRGLKIKATAVTNDARVSLNAFHGIPLAPSQVSAGPEGEGVVRRLVSQLASEARDQYRELTVMQNDLREAVCAVHDGRIPVGDSAPASSHAHVKDMYQATLSCQEAHYRLVHQVACLEDTYLNLRLAPTLEKDSNSSASSSSSSSSSQRNRTDKLRVLCSSLLKLLTRRTDWTVSTFTYTIKVTMTAERASALFRSLSVFGTLELRSLVMDALSQLGQYSGNSSWWGSGIVFATNMLRENFSSRAHESSSAAPEALHRDDVFDRDNVSTRLAVIVSRAPTQSLVMSHALTDLLQWALNAPHLDNALVSWTVIWMGDCLDRLPPRGTAPRDTWIEFLTQSELVLHLCHILAGKKDDPCEPTLFVLVANFLMKLMDIFRTQVSCTILSYPRLADILDFGLLNPNVPWVRVSASRIVTLAFSTSFGGSGNEKPNPDGMAITADLRGVLVKQISNLGSHRLESLVELYEAYSVIAKSVSKAHKALKSTNANRYVPAEVTEASVRFLINGALNTRQWSLVIGLLSYSHPEHVVACEGLPSLIDMIVGCRAWIRLSDAISFCAHILRHPKSSADVLKYIMRSVVRWYASAFSDSDNGNVCLIMVRFIRKYSTTVTALDLQDVVQFTTDVAQMLRLAVVDVPAASNDQWKQLEEKLIRHALGLLIALLELPDGHILRTELVSEPLAPVIKKYVRWLGRARGAKLQGVLQTFLCLLSGVPAPPTAETDLAATNTASAIPKSPAVATGDGEEDTAGASLVADTPDDDDTLDDSKLTASVDDSTLERSSLKSTSTTSSTATPDDQGTLRLMSSCIELMKDRTEQGGVVEAVTAFCLDRLVCAPSLVQVFVSLGGMEVLLKQLTTSPDARMRLSGILHPSSNTIHAPTSLKLSNNELNNFAPYSVISSSPSGSAKPVMVLTPSATGWSHAFSSKEKQVSFKVILPYNVNVSQITLSSPLPDHAPQAVEILVGRPSPSVYTSLGVFRNSHRTMLQVDLPTNTVVRAVQLRLYRPKYADAMKIQQLRIMGHAYDPQAATTCASVTDSSVMKLPRVLGSLHRLVMIHPPTATDLSVNESAVTMLTSLLPHLDKLPDLLSLLWLLASADTDTADRILEACLASNSASAHRLAGRICVIDPEHRHKRLTKFTAVLLCAGAELRNGPVLKGKSHLVSVCENLVHAISLGTEPFLSLAKVLPSHSADKPLAPVGNSPLVPAQAALSLLRAAEITWADQPVASSLLKVVSALAMASTRQAIVFAEVICDQPVTVASLAFLGAVYQAHDPVDDSFPTAKLDTLLAEQVGRLSQVTEDASTQEHAIPILVYLTQISDTETATKLISQDTFSAIIARLVALQNPTPEFVDLLVEFISRYTNARPEHQGLVCHAMYEVLSDARHKPCDDESSDEPASTRFLRNTERQHILRTLLQKWLTRTDDVLISAFPQPLFDLDEFFVPSTESQYDNPLLHSDLVRSKLDSDFITNAIHEVLAEQSPARPAPHKKGHLVLKKIWTWKHGDGSASCKQFGEKCMSANPTLLVIRNQQGEVFGGYTASGFQPGPAFYGDSRSFLFNCSERTIFKSRDSHVAVKWDEAQSVLWGLGPDLSFSPSAGIKCMSKKKSYRCVSRRTNSHGILKTPFYEPAFAEVWTVELEPRTINSVSRPLLGPSARIVPVYRVPVSTPLEEVCRHLVPGQPVADTTPENAEPATLILHHSALSSRVGVSIGSGVTVSDLQAHIEATTGSRAVHMDLVVETEATLADAPTSFTTLVHIPDHHSVWQAPCPMRFFAKTMSTQLLVDVAREGCAAPRVQSPEAKRFFSRLHKDLMPLPGFAEAFMASKAGRDILFYCSGLSDASKVETLSVSLLNRVLFELVEAAEANAEARDSDVKHLQDLLHRLIIDGALENVVADLAALTQSPWNNSNNSTNNSNANNTSDASPTANPTSTVTSTAPSETAGDNGDTTTQYWAKGTGFGHGSFSEWSPEDHLAAEAVRHSEMVPLLRIIESAASYCNGDRGAYPIFARLMCNDEGGVMSMIIPFLRNDSLLDMGRHAAFYVALLELISQLTVNSLFVPLLIEAHGGTSIEDLLPPLQRIADTFLQRSRLLVDEQSTDTQTARTIVNAIVDTCHLVTEAAAQYRAEGAAVSVEEESGSVASDLAEVVSPASGEDDPATRYVNLLNPLQFDTMDMHTSDDALLSTSHFYSKDILSADNAGGAHSARMLRLVEEATSLSTGLPVSNDSGIFVRADDSRLDVMQVLIIGPVGTPYAGGCFKFDVFFPVDYPTSPPLMNLMTTGNGAVRFNPNLYNSGKVCLSLLNTWSGSNGEKWNSRTSTLLQVLVSIQSLILVPEPYFNEPGFEQSIGTPEGDEASAQYNETIRLGTVQHAIIDMIRSPPPGFEDVIRIHFKLKKDRILSQIETWAGECKSARISSRLEYYATQLKDLVDQLTLPSADDSDEDDDSSSSDESD